MGYKMLKINNVVCPSAEQWLMAIRGMRHPLQSYDRSDTTVKDNEISLGDNDLGLMKRLIHAGTEHRKFLRQLPVIVEMTAPSYWISELDTYKISTTKNSSSLQHKGASKPFTIRDFSVCDEIYDILDPIKIKKEHPLLYKDVLETDYKEYTVGDRTYKVFKNGKVISCEYERTHETDNRTRHFKEYEVVPSQNSEGYYYLSLGGRKYHERIMLHRLMANVWLKDKYFPGAEVNHKDGNKGNNCIDNLEWVTHKDNEIHKHQNGLSGRTIHTDYIAWKNASKTDIADREEIRRLYAEGMKQTEIAKLFDIGQSQVGEIIRCNESEKTTLFELALGWEKTLNALNTLREKYLDTGEYKYFIAMRALIPMGYNYTFTWSANYEVLYSIYFQRENHKLTEWHDFCRMIRHLPYMDEFLFGGRYE